MRGAKMRGGQLPFALPPTKSLFPDEEAQFVAEIEEALVLRVVASADEITAEILEELDVDEMLRGRERRAGVRVKFVAVEAEEFDWAFVKQDLATRRTDRAEAEANDVIVFADADGERVKVG